MKSLKVLRVELKKVIFNWGFVLSIFVTFALLLTTQVYSDSTGKIYTVLDSLFITKTQLVKDAAEFSSIMILQGAQNSYFGMFVAIIAAFPFIPNFCEERNSGLIRFTIQRTGKLRYYIIKFITALLGGGLSILTGFFLFTLLIVIMFPSIDTYGLTEEIMQMYTGGLVAQKIVLLNLGMFVYGCFSTVPAFLMASFVKNRYVITCVPFMLLYLYSSFLTKLLYDGMETRNKKLMELAYTLKPEEVSGLVRHDKINQHSIIINTVFTIFSLIIFIIIMNRRLDSGE